MNILSTLVLLGLQNKANAGTPYINPLPISDNFSEWKLAEKMGTIEAVEIDGSVDVPLYTDYNDKPNLVTFGGTSADSQEDMFFIMPAASFVIVSPDFAKENELEIKTTNKRLIPVPDDFKTGGEIKYVEIPELHIGTLILRNVTAFVSNSETKGFDSTGDFSFKKMAIGLGALPASYAILESEGVLRVSDDGAKLLSDLGGTNIPYQERGWTIGTIGKKTITKKNETIIPALSLLVPVSFDGKEPTTAMIAPFASISALDKYYPVSSDIYKSKADLQFDWLTATVGGLELNPSYFARPTTVNSDDTTLPMSSIGRDILGHYDIVVDKTTNTIGLKENSQQKRTASYDKRLGKAQSDLEEALKDDPEATDSETTEDSTEKTMPIGEMSRLASLTAFKSTEEALKLQKEILTEEEEATDCSRWLELGHNYRLSGNVEEAQKSYQEAARLYHSWWDIDLNRRMDINNAQADMKEEEIDAAKAASKDTDINSVEDGWYISQPSSCYVADGFNAYTDMLQGNYDAVESNYRQNFDLDVNLGFALGNTALLQGKTELAHEAYRQAILFEDGAKERSFNRLGLALVYADQGKWEQADSLFQEAMSLNSDAIIRQLWLDNLRAVKGEEEALNSVGAWIDAHPLDGNAKVALLREFNIQIGNVNAKLSALQPAEGEELSEEQSKKQAELQKNLEVLNQAFEGSKTKMEGFFADIGYTYRRNEALRDAVYAQYLIFSGDLEGAEATLKEASTTETSQLSLAWANLYAMQGKTDKATQALKRAAELNPQNAGYALFLKE